MRDAGLPAATHGPGDEIAWAVEGMDCSSCVGKVERAVARLPGVSDVRVNMAAERLSLRPVPSGQSLS